MFASRESPLKSIAKDAVVYLPAKAIPAIVGFLSIAVFTRFLAPEQYGIFVLVITGVRILSATVFGWLDRSTLRFFEDYRGNNLLPNLISTNLSFLVISAGVISIVLLSATWIAEPFLEPGFIPVLRIGILVLVTQSFYEFFMTVNRASRATVRFSLYAGFDSLGRFLLATAFLYYFSMDERAILWGFVFTGTIVSVFEFIRWVKVARIRPGLFVSPILKRSALYGLPLVGHAFGLLVLSVSDRYMVQYYLGSDQVGVYSAGYNLTSFIVDSLFNGTILLAAFPVIIQVFESRGREEAGSLLRDLFCTYAILGTPLVFGLSALGKGIVGIALGEEYQQSYEIIPWVAGGLFFWGLTTYSIKAFELGERTMNITYIVLFSGLVNILGNVLLIPALGINGAAISTFFSYFVCFAASAFFGNRIMRLQFPWKTFVKAVSAAVTMYVVMAYLDKLCGHAWVGIPMLCAVGFLTYVCTLVVLREESLGTLVSYARGLYS